MSDTERTGPAGDDDLSLPKGSFLSNIKKNNTTDWEKQNSNCAKVD